MHIKLRLITYVAATLLIYVLPRSCCYHASKISPSDGFALFPVPHLFVSAVRTNPQERSERLEISNWCYVYIDSDCSLQACTKWRAETILNWCCLMPLKFASSDCNQRLRISVWRYWLNGCCYATHYCPFDIPFVVFLGSIPAIAPSKHCIKAIRDLFLAHKRVF